MEKKTKNLMKKVGVASALIATVTPIGLQMATPMVVQASENQESFSEHEFNQDLNYIQQFVERKADGTIGLIEGVPESIKQEFQLDSLEAYFATLNEQVKDGTIKINDDLTIESYLRVRGGKTYMENYWWGIRNYYSTQAAKNKITQVRNMAIAQGTAAGIAGLFGFLPGAVTGAIGSAWGNMLANSMENKNNQTNRGIIVDINWAAIYSVSIQ